MFLHKITLPDGAALDSGAIRSVQLTGQVNDQTDLCPGAACAACAEIELWAPRNGLTIAQGTEITLARINAESGAQTPVGVFLAEKPQKKSANVIRVTAYDRMTLLDKDLSPWLRDQQGSFPMPLGALVEAVCAQCGVELLPGNLEAQANTSYSVLPFYADGMTGRQIVQWAAQAMCRFARMTPAGQLEFAWYAPAGTGIGPAGYFADGLTYEDYQTAPIDKVQIRQSAEDVGVLYPPDETAANALVLEGNLLLTSQTAEALAPVAQAIYEIMKDIRYTPLTVSVPLDADSPAPGEIVTVEDAYGRRMQAYIMQRTISGQKVTLESTGHARRDGTAAVNEQKLNVNGKLLEISATVDGLRVTASNLQKDYTELTQTVDGLELTVVTEGNIRTKFAADSTSVTISSGVITFTANSLVVDSDNFQLDHQGNVRITGSFYSNAANGNQVNLADGIAAFYARDSSGQSYPTTIITRSASANPYGILDVYGRAASGAVNIQVRLQGGLTDGSIHLYNAFGTEQGVLTSGEGNVSWLAGGLDVRGSHGVQAYYGSIGRLQITELGVNGGAIQKVYWKWDGNLRAYVLSTSS